jgi:hypothetical protein
MEELDCTFTVITETWLRDSEKLSYDCQDIQDGAGFSTIYKNRPVNNRGVAHGGICIMARDSRAKMSRFRFHNAGNYEVLAAIASLKGHARKLAIVAVYMPPSMDSGTLKSV